MHLRYLTYDFDTKTAWIPNKEERQEFLNSIQGQEFQNVNNAIHRSDKLLQLTLAQNAEKVAEMLQEVHCDNCSVIQYNDENSLACVLSLAYYSAQDSYAIYRELQGGEGFVDLVFVPRTGNQNPAMIVELKWNQSTGIALEQIKNRNYRFIIYMDDLSFEEFEIEYKYLKAVIEGGLEKKPDNILIYATSNRRHLVRETFKDKADRDEELHTNDTVQEKLSLVARFGVTIYFGKPDKKEFQKIVTTLADRYGVEMEEEKLLLEANKWELSHGGLSGRTAQQFIDYLLGQQ